MLEVKVVEENILTTLLKLTDRNNKEEIEAWAGRVRADIRYGGSAQTNLGSTSPASRTGKEDKVHEVP